MILICFVIMMMMMVMMMVMGRGGHAVSMWIQLLFFVTRTVLNNYCCIQVM